MAIHSWFPVETNFSVLEIVSEFSFSAAPCMLHTCSWRSWTLLPVLLARKLKRSFAPSYLRVKAKACRLVHDLVLLSRMYSATTVNVRRLVLTPARYTSVCFDESERLSSPDIRVTLFFALLAFIQAMVLGEPISLRSVWFSLCNTSLSDFQMYL